MSLAHHLNILALGHHFPQVAQAQPEGQIPTDESKTRDWSKWLPINMLNHGNFPEMIVVPLSAGYSCLLELRSGMPRVRSGTLIFFVV